MATNVDRLIAENQVNQAEIDLLAETFDESTSLSWLWSLMFGPIYFLVHGFWGRALIVFILCFFIIGYLIPPFIVYPAWRERARIKAANVITIDRFRNPNK